MSKLRELVWIFGLAAWAFLAVAVAATIADNATTKFLAMVLGGISFVAWQVCEALEQ